jgi:trigger factor
VRDSENHRRNAVWEAIVEDTVVHKLPKAERDTAIDNMILEHRTYAQMVGMSSLAELAMEWSGMTEAEYINEEIIPFAESGVKQDLTLRAIASAEGFSISNADYRAGVTRFTEEFDYESESAFIEANGEDMIRIALLADKVMNFIVDNAIAK